MNKNNSFKIMWLLAILTIFYAVSIQNWWLSIVAIVVSGIFSWYARKKR